MNDYKSFCLKDLLALIDRVAIETMMLPLRADCDLSKENVNRMNNDILWNNEGIRDMAASLKNALLEGADGDE